MLVSLDVAMAFFGHENMVFLVIVNLAMKATFGVWKEFDPPNFHRAEDIKTLPHASKR